jgi:hypothetical protein
MLWLIWWLFIPLRHPTKYQGPPKQYPVKRKRTAHGKRR